MNRRQSLNVEGRSVLYTTHFNSKARQLSLRISPGSGLVLVLPKRLQGRDINYEELLKTKIRWILKELDKVAILQRNGISFVDGETLSLQGRQITLRVIQTTQVRATAYLENDALLVLTRNTDELRVKAIVKDWCKLFAKNVLPVRVGELNASHGFAYNRITVRDQRSRWGSCSRKGTLSFNWRLVLVPPAVLDYLIYHELAHLQEMNHSIRFWRLVQSLYPTYREAERWLKKNGRSMFW